MTVGAVSATGRTSLGINDYEDFVQTDAANNPGNSGGPLVNLDGEVVRMNTAILSRSGGYMGVGFAIPSNLVSSVANQLIQSGELTRGYLGIVIQQLTPDLAESFELAQHRGILVAQVAEGSPAAEAGLRQGDVVTEVKPGSIAASAGIEPGTVILQVKRKPVQDASAFKRAIQQNPDKRVLLLIRRGGMQQFLVLQC